MKKIITFAVAAMAMGAIWMGTAREASADVDSGGRLSFSSGTVGDTYVTQKKVTVIRDAAGRETVIVEESPTIVKHRPAHHKKFHNRHGDRHHHRWGHRGTGRH